MADQGEIRLLRRKVVGGLLGSAAASLVHNYRQSPQMSIKQTARCCSARIGANARVQESRHAGHDDGGRIPAGRRLSFNATRGVRHQMAAHRHALLWSAMTRVSEIGFASVPNQRSCPLLPSAPQRRQCDLSKRASAPAQFKQAILVNDRIDIPQRRLSTAELLALWSPMPCHTAGISHR